MKKFDVDASAVRETVTASGAIIMPTAPALAADATQALQAAASPPRSRISSLVRGTWFPDFGVPGCLGGDPNAGQARTTRTRFLLPEGSRRRRKPDPDDEK